MTKEEREAEKARKALQKKLREEERERAKSEKERIAEEKRLEKERKERYVSETLHALLLLVNYQLFY
ncbi:hypothetical protein OESDEN_14430 [Oesophagostomum dentatum]|uniref:Uncharacterized protein n=1 Tax=Oesophagostomum dentatum TaxID=61180 RepID=A0A0B1SLL6_OESDE|nr:hypothetical protein OESDEN_14430 [Oesophagostomum dentatum]